MVSLMVSCIYCIRLRAFGLRFIPPVPILILLNRAQPGAIVRHLASDPAISSLPDAAMSQGGGATHSPTAVFVECY